MLSPIVFLLLGNLTILIILAIIGIVLEDGEDK